MGRGSCSSAGHVDPSCRMVAYLEQNDILLAVREMDVDRLAGVVSESPTALPREGLLEFSRTPQDPPDAVTAIRSVFCRRDTGELLNPNSLDLEWLESGGREEIALDQIKYTAMVEQLEGAACKVGRAKYTCCV